MFLKLSDKGEILVMDLSGQVKEFYPYPPEKKELLLKLLHGELKQIPWDDYSYELPRKEVIIPVFDDSGKVLGAFIRSGIE